MFSSIFNFAFGVADEESGNRPAHLLPRYKAGYLLMETKLANKKWKPFVVTLAGTNINDLALFYYSKPSDTEPIGRIPLCSAHVDLLEEMVMIITQDDTWFLCAENEQEAVDWVRTITQTLESSSGKRQVHERLERLSSRATQATIREIQSRDVSARIYEFKELFLKASAHELRGQASRGALAWSCLRGITWRFWLGYYPMALPFAEWANIARDHRLRYTSLRQVYPIDHLQEELSKTDPDEAPEVFIEDISGIALTEEEVEDASLLADICKDVRRTRSRMEYFRQDHVQEMLVRILYIYSKAHSETHYHQGMNELLAVIFYLLHVEQWPVTTESVDSVEKALEEDNVDPDIRPFGKSHELSSSNVRFILETATSGEFIEHDAFLLLEGLMSRMSGVFCPTRRASAADALELNDQMTTLNAQLDRIHNQLLSTIDPELHSFFTRLGIEPPMYLLRWVRLLMAREFEMYHVWQIWDAIFGLTPDTFSLMDYFCVAAVRHFRDEIMAQEDVPSVLICLRHLGKEIPVEGLVDAARQMYQDNIFISSH